ncbi:sensor histidine kinase [Haloglycomyces albus]|uniref:sensor histidine kinase n=1 Tax=Haloglycomyces albus TaxID=526067 RepID=UPI00046D2A91|nr:HAMP domain-containing sensor histidine kinase [Haloglycomyces albus]
MSIKAKISAAIAVLVIVAVTAIGLVTINVVSTQLTDQVDQQIEKYVQQIITKGNWQELEHDNESRYGYYKFAQILYDTDGEKIVGIGSGYENDPDPLPDIPSAPEAGRFFTVSAVEGNMDYRAVAVQDSYGRTLVIAESLSDVKSAVKALTATVIICGSLVAVTAIMVVWMIMQRGLRSVDRMVHDAEVVAGGNLNHRMTPSPANSEMGRLSAALNLMVNRLTHSIRESETQQKRLKQFVADAGHELRTPLTAIGGYVQLYQNGAARDGEKLDRAMERIGAENSRLARLVDDLMVLAKLDQNVQKERTPVDLTQLATDAVDDATAADTRHSFELTPAPTIIVLANEGQIRQILVNLINNARTHTPDGSTVTVSVHDDTDTALITVADDGPGIPEQHRRRIFDRFYRADPSRSRQTGGTGLGLSIVAAIVASHQGTIDLHSSEGNGTSVTVRIPKVWLEDTSDEQQEK